jgi:dGTPase
LRETRALKAFLRDNLYTHRKIYAERKRIVQCVAQMFEFYMEHPRSLPRFYFAKTKQEPTYRVVCDYIAGMTDNYLGEQHRKYVER